MCMFLAHFVGHYDAVFCFLLQYYPSLFTSLTNYAVHIPTSSTQGTNLFTIFDANKALHWFLPWVNVYKTDCFVPDKDCFLMNESMNYHSQFIIRITKETKFWGQQICITLETISFVIEVEFCYVAKNPMAKTNCSTSSLHQISLAWGKTTRVCLW